MNGIETAIVSDQTENIQNKVLNKLIDFDKNHRELKKEIRPIFWDTYRIKHNLEDVSELTPVSLKHTLKTIDMRINQEENSIKDSQAILQKNESYKDLIKSLNIRIKTPNGDLMVNDYELSGFDLNQEMIEARIHQSRRQIGNLKDRKSEIEAEIAKENENEYF